MLIYLPFASTSVLGSESVASDESNFVVSSDGRKVVDNAENNVNQKEGHQDTKFYFSDCKTQQ